MWARGPRWALSVLHHVLMSFGSSSVNQGSAGDAGSESLGGQGCHLWLEHAPCFS